MSFVLPQLCCLFPVHNWYLQLQILQPIYAGKKIKIYYVYLQKLVMSQVLSASTLFMSFKDLKTFSQACLSSILTNINISAPFFSKEAHAQYAVHQNLLSFKVLAITLFFTMRYHNVIELDWTVSILRYKCLSTSCKRLPCNGFGKA